MSDGLDLADIAPHEMNDLRIECWRLPSAWRAKFERLLDTYEDQQDMVERSDYDAVVEERDEWEKKASDFEEERDSARLQAADRQTQIDDLQAEVDSLRKQVGGAELEVNRLRAKLQKIFKLAGVEGIES